MSEILYTILYFAFFGLVVWRMADGMARAAPRDLFLMLLIFRWFVAGGIALAGLLHLLIPRDDSFAERAGVALLLFPFGGLLFTTMHETLMFVGMALRASRRPDDKLDLLPDHWFDRKLRRFIRRRLWLSRLLDFVFRTESYRRLTEQLKASAGRESEASGGSHAPVGPDE